MQRYRDYNSYLRELFGERVQKISLDAGFSCPNRDGSISSEGCIFCDSRGSGSGAMIQRNISLEKQILSGMEIGLRRYKAKKYIAYFQSFTNTYAPADVLEDLYKSALSYQGMVGLSIGTRPDCVDHNVLNLLNSFTADYLVWIEYGLQSSHDITLKRINRGHDVKAFEKAVKMSSDLGLDICAHVILGLPGETREMMLETAEFLAGQPITGVKIHSLFVTRGTSLAGMYLSGKFRCMEREEYIETLIDFLELLPPDYVIQRLTGDPDRNDMLAPAWALEKSENIALIRKRLEERNTWQGRRYRVIGH